MGSYGAMTGVLFPIAATPEAALDAPLGRAGLQSAAQWLTGVPVGFARELAGPAFETREAAAQAYSRRVDGPGATVLPEDRYCDLQSVAGRTGTVPRTVWRICVGYWKVGEARAVAVEQARRARRRPEAATLDQVALGAMAEQPLRSHQPQKALDIGLFEMRLPEDPDRIIPDE
jgi:hypothetical protein